MPAAWMGVLGALAATGAWTVPDLPVAVTNNAVASVQRDDGMHLVSLMGLLKDKQWNDTTLAAWHLAPGAAGWRRLPDVPGEDGRLAGAAVGIGHLVYVFGGYTVAEDHSEVSVPLVHSLDPVSGRYVGLAPMPVPVDDAVALPFRDRYVYLVSGWHDSGNVNLVQRYDIETDRWSQATPWPGRAVFGHAGGIVGDTLVICDGVAVRPTRAKRRFVAAPVCLKGVIDADNGLRIDWTAMPHHPGPALYRMAAAGTQVAGEAAVLFAGGSPNPYNYNGIGYDGKPSPASAAVFAWLIDSARWRRLGRLGVATMDHRGLVDTGQGLAIVGGMREGQQVSAQIVFVQESH